MKTLENENAEMKNLKLSIILKQLLIWAGIAGIGYIILCKFGRIFLFFLKGSAFLLGVAVVILAGMYLEGARGFNLLDSLPQWFCAMLTNVMIGLCILAGLVAAAMNR